MMALLFQDVCFVSNASDAAGVIGLELVPLVFARLGFQEGGMTLEDLEASMNFPIVATPPALLRPGVGPAARGASGRGRAPISGHPGVSSSFQSSRCVGQRET